MTQAEFELAIPASQRSPRSASYPTTKVNCRGKRRTF